MLVKQKLTSEAANICILHRTWLWNWSPGLCVSPEVWCGGLARRFRQHSPARVPCVALTTFTTRLGKPQLLPCSWRPRAAKLGGLKKTKTKNNWLQGSLRRVHRIMGLSKHLCSICSIGAGRVFVCLFVLKWPDQQNWSFLKRKRERKKGKKKERKKKKQGITSLMRSWYVHLRESKFACCRAERCLLYIHFHCIAVHNCEVAESA